MLEERTADGIDITTQIESVLNAPGCTRSL